MRINAIYEDSCLRSARTAFFVPLQEQVVAAPPAQSALDTAKTSKGESNILGSMSGVHITDGKVVTENPPAASASEADEMYAKWMARVRAATRMPPCLLACVVRRVGVAE